MLFFSINLTFRTKPKLFTDALPSRASSSSQLGSSKIVELKADGAKFNSLAPVERELINFDSGAPPEKNCR